MGKTTKEIVVIKPPLKGAVLFRRIYMKSIIALTLAGIVAMSTPIIVDAANINASKYTATYGNYNGMKLNEGVTIYANAPKALFAGAGKIDVKTTLMQAGASRAEVYTLNIKNGNEMNYAIFANVIVSSKNNLVNTKHVSTDSSSVGNLVASINGGTAKELGQYRVVSPLTKHNKAYMGTLKYISKDSNNNSYNELLHIAISDSKYEGPNVRFIAVDEENDAKIFPRISNILNVK